MNCIQLSSGNTFGDCFFVFTRCIADYVVREKKKQTDIGWKMEKKNLVELLSEIFFPLGFKRKGNNWIYEGEELSKIVNLQKSYYSKSFYINYGYNIRNLELTTFMHVGNRFASADREKQRLITDLLDLDYAIPQAQRLFYLKKLINEIIVPKMEAINTEEDVLHYLEKRPMLNDIPLVVKEYFQLG